MGPIADHDNYWSVPIRSLDFEVQCTHLPSPTCLSFNPPPPFLCPYMRLSYAFMNYWSGFSNLLVFTDQSLFVALFCPLEVKIFNGRWNCVCFSFCWQSMMTFLSPGLGVRSMSSENRVGELKTCTPMEVVHFSFCAESTSDSTLRFCPNETPYAFLSLIFPTSVFFLSHSFYFSSFFFFDVSQSYSIYHLKV